jgi:ribosome biogenesis GTPase / thiamine phosphate phosphatase
VTTPSLHQQEKLEALGWNDFFAEQALAYPGLLPARVSRPDLNRYHLLAASGPLTGLLPGRARSAGQTKAELPTVGDWVLVSDPAAQAADTGDELPSGTVLIEVTLKRKSKFSRKEAGERYDEQVVAANIDTVFLVTGLDDNFNVNRIERYLLLAWTSGASPVIILSKADLCQGLERKLEKVAAIAMATPVHVVSATADQGMDALRTYVTKGKTVALLGSSGVGKSTITNYLLGHDYFDTGAVRATDSRGRHTTTFRELCLLADGGMLIDTPGMREIQIWADQDTLAASFSDVADLAYQCRFNDCQHQSEPGCAVHAAIAAGELLQARLDTFQRFKDELAVLTARNVHHGRGAKRPTKKKS